MKTIHCTVQRTIVLPVETYDFAGKAGEVMGYRLNNRPFAPRELRVGDEIDDLYGGPLVVVSIYVREEAKI